MLEISSETNVLKISKTLMRPYIVYYTQAWAPVLRYGKKERNMEIVWKHIKKK